MRRGEVIGERYRLERQLGQGPMAEVWLANDLELQRPIALKLLAPGGDDARFEREARAAAALNHPNVMRLYDYGEVGGRPYMALEFLGGGTLEERLPDRPLQDNETRAIVVQLAAGLAHAHAQGLVHRDLKPANILFDDEDRPKIADFGIARIGTGSTLTEAGTVLGTAAYISPEQAAGEPATPASDVYSFGVVLFRMLTGRLPFESDRPLEVVEMHRRLEAPKIESLRPGAPAELAAVAEAALAKDPRDRPADGAALAAELGGRTPVAATGEVTLVLSRRPRRARLLLALAALCFAAAAGTTGAFLLTREHSTSPAPTIPSRTRAGGSSTTSSAASASASTSTSTPATTAPATTTAPLPVTTTLPTVPTTTPTTSATTTTIPATAPTSP